MVPECGSSSSRCLNYTNPCISAAAIPALTGGNRDEGRGWGKPGADAWSPETPHQGSTTDTGAFHAPPSSPTHSHRPPPLPAPSLLLINRVKLVDQEDLVLSFLEQPEHKYEKRPALHPRVGLFQASCGAHVGSRSITRV